VANVLSHQEIAARHVAKTDAVMSKIMANATIEALSGGGSDNGATHQSPPNDKGNTGSSGSGNNGNSNKGGSDMTSTWRGKDPQFWVGAIATIIGSIALAITAIKSDPNKRDAANAEMTNSITQQKIAEATGAIPPGWTLPPQAATVTQNPRPAVAGTGQKVVIDATKDFSCNTDADRQAGFAAGNVQHVNASSQMLHLKSKCLLVNLTGTVSGLEAKGYRFSVPDPAIPGNYYKCGDLGSNNDSIATCVDFANRWAGKDMRISVIDGGFVHFN
jgi:hypothetical protein